MDTKTIQQWAREAGMAGMLTDVVTNFAELQQFATLARADLEANLELQGNVLRKTTEELIALKARAAHPAQPRSFAIDPESKRPSKYGSEELQSLILAKLTQPIRVPLTIQEVDQILHQHDYELHGDRARYIVRMTEQAHGIGGDV